MKRNLVAGIGVIGMAGAVSADPAQGVWKTQVDDGAYAYVQMSPCGAALCGTISRTFNSGGEYTSATSARSWFGACSPQVMVSTSAGKIWQPSTGKTYKSKMALSGNTLKVSGCVGPICKKQIWSRVK